MPSVFKSYEPPRTSSGLAAGSSSRNVLTAQMFQRPHVPAELMRAPVRACQHKSVHDEHGNLLLNMGSTVPFKVAPQAPIFRPMGSVPPETNFPGRPFTSHAPGRHRFFMGDISPKI